MDGSLQIMEHRIKVKCRWCGKKVDKPAGEVTRSLKLKRALYCNLKCAAHASNAPRKAKAITRNCPFCGQAVPSSTRVKARKFCSRSHASKYAWRHASKKRREAQREYGRRYGKIYGHQGGGNLISPQETLSKRESWKYELLRKHLDRNRRNYCFEYVLDKAIFDLALLDKKILIEFDGPYHRALSQRPRDQEKEQIASAHGFRLIRRRVIPTTVISAKTLRGV